MVAVEQPAAVVQKMDPAVGEAARAGAKTECPQHCTVSDQAKREDRTKPGHRRNLGREELAARRYLRPLWLVLRRDAADRIGDAAVVKRKAIGGVGTVGAASKAELTEGGVEQVAGEIAREGPACAVRPAQAGCQADDQQPGVKVAEARNRRIVPVRLGRPVILPVGNESRAAVTIPIRHGRSRHGPRSRRVCDLVGYLVFVALVVVLLVFVPHRLPQGPGAFVPPLRLARDHGFEILQFDEVIGLAT